MRDAMRLLPPWIGRALSITYVLHDLAFLTVAIVAVFVLPPSVERALETSAWVWIGCVGLGSLTGVAGTLTRNVRLEVLGCGLMVAGLVTYSTALLVQMTVRGVPTGLAAAFIFLAATFSLASRIVVMFAAIYLREPK